MSKEQIENSIVKSLKEMYGIEDIEVVVDVGSNTWNVELDSEESIEC